MFSHRCDALDSHPRFEFGKKIFRGAPIFSQPATSIAYMVVDISVDNISLDTGE
jgi:hypothetical protein